MQFFGRKSCEMDYSLFSISVRVHEVGGLPDPIQEQAAPVLFQDENGTPL